MSYGQANIILQLIFVIQRWVLRKKNKERNQAEIIAKKS